METVFNNIQHDVEDCAVERDYEAEETNSLDIQLAEAKQVIKTLEEKNEMHINEIQRMKSKLALLPQSGLHQFAVNATLSQDDKVSYNKLISLNL